MENKFGLSKKTNITIAAIGGVTMVKEFTTAIIAIIVIALIAVTYQFCIDRKE